MAAIPPLNVKVNIDASGVTVGVAQATRGLEQITARTNAVSASMGKFKNVALGVFGGNVLTAGIFGVERLLVGMKEEVVEAQVANQRLAAAMATTKGITDQQTAAVNKNVAAYSSLGFQDAEAANAMGTLITATGDVTQSTKLMASAADLARYKHIDMNTAATILARGTQGSAKAFKEMGITLDTTIPKNKAIAKAFDELNAKIGGQSVAYTKTFAGQMAVMKEKFDAVAIAVGKVLLPIFTVLATVLGKLADYITKNGKALAVFAGIVIATTVALKTYAVTTAAIKSVQQAYAFWTYAQAASTSVFRFALQALWTTMKANPIGVIVTGLTILATAFVYAWNHSQTFRNVVVTSIQVVINAIGYLVGGVSKLLRAMSYLPGMKFLRGVADSADKAADSIRKVSNNLDSLRKKDSAAKAPKIAGVTAPGGKTGIIGNVPGGDTSKTSGGGGGGSTNVQHITVYASNTNDIERKMARAAKNGTPIGGK